jgi:hypothetical protein
MKPPPQRYGSLALIPKAWPEPATPANGARRSL